MLGSVVDSSTQEIQQASVLQTSQLSKMSSKILVGDPTITASGVCFFSSAKVGVRQNRSRTL